MQSTSSASSRPRMEVLGVIPARLGSTRLPRKVLRDIGGRPLVAWVYDAACRAKSLTDVVVATDSAEVMSACEALAIPAIMTSEKHPCGSDRIHEVMGKRPADIYVNIQGDEPLLKPEHLDLLLSPFFDRAGVYVSTLKVAIDNDQAQDPNNVKVIADCEDRALYFSRYPIPYDRDGSGNVQHYKHLGLYAYRGETLERFHSLPPSTLELAEKLEQLRFLQNGIPVHVLETRFDTIGVDTEADLLKVQAVLEGR